MASSSLRIGLLGGSFDPVHKGHLEIIQSFLDSSYIEKLYVILSPDPPHKGDQDITDFKHRYNMLKIALDGIDNLSISTIEKELPKPSYTINTVTYFSNKFPDEELYLCIGEDSYVKFTSWHKWEDIINTCTLLIAQRPDAGENNVPAKLKSNARFVEHNAVDISSSNLREQISLGEEVEDLLPKGVWSYIQNNHLYGIDCK